MSNPWNGKAVLETFWWNCWNGNYPFDWYTYLAKLAPRIAALGFDGIWTPPPCKDTNAQNNMGYTPYDYYDIGQKNQNGATGTRFGTQDSFLRLVAVAHANGLEVYPDIVLDHCGGAASIPPRRGRIVIPCFIQLVSPVRALDGGPAIGSTFT
jgi:alpha-amylase